MGRYVDEDGNEITLIQKWLGGASLIAVSLLVMTVIIGFWPDRIPKADDNYESYYRISLFRTRLIRVPVSFLEEENRKWLNAAEGKTNASIAKPDINDAKGKAQKTTAKNDSAKKDIAKKSDSTVAANQQTNADKKTISDTSSKKKDIKLSATKERLDDLIHLNTLLLLLVGLTGFLGNLIHVATSFTTFLGSGQFKRSWMLWYYVKPFIAASLAIVMYFVICGGFLTVNNSPNNLNIYGVLTIAMLTGLFTDRATLKLKEVFEVLLKPKEDRADPLLGTLKIESISPGQLSRIGENTISVTGENLLKEKLSFLLDDSPIDPKITAKTATYKFTLNAAQLAKPFLKLIIKNEKGAILEQRELLIPPVNP